MCVCVCVPFPRGSLHLLAGGAVQGYVPGSGLLPRPATPGWGVEACVCLCGRPACTPPFLAGVCGVGVRAGLRFWLCSAPLGLVVGVCVFVRVPRLHPFLPGGGPWRGSVRVLSRVGFAPPLPFGVSFGGGGAVACRVVALWCQSLAVPVLGLVVSVPPSPLVRAVPSCVFCFFSPPQAGVCWRVPSSGGPLLPVWCCRFLAGWSSSSPSGGPVLGAVCLGGLAAFCGMGGRFRGCGPFSCPPPRPFFRGGGVACSSLCLPWADACTGRHSVWSSGLLLVFGFCQALPWPHGRVGYVHVGVGGPSCWVRFWLCRLGGCARRLREALD